MAFSIWDLHANGWLSTVILGFVVFLLVRMWLTSGGTKWKLPPGPRPYPLIGNLPTFIKAKDFPVKLMELKEVYGNIFKLHFGSIPIVVVCDLPTIREGLVKKGEFTNGRANTMHWVHRLFNKKGVLFSTGQTWKHMRRFALTSLRDLGMGKLGIEIKIHEEFTEVHKAIEATRGRPFDLKKPIIDAVFNIIHNIIFGERLDYDDPDFDELTSIFDFLFLNGTNRLIENFLPWPDYIPWKTTTQQLLEHLQRLRVYILRKIQDHRETFDENNIRDLIDMYLLMIQKESTDKFSEDDVFRTVVDLFLAGAETTATSLIWVFLYVTKYSDVQNKCREEITKLTDMNRLVRMEDKKDLPYVCATIFEVLRMATSLRATIPHMAEQDITLGGYDIPKGTVLQFLIHSVHMDPKYWKNPKEFDPNRWLDEEGKLKQNEAFLPFSLGPRNCIGEPLARMELFLFFTNLIQNLELLSVEDEPVSISGRSSGATYRPDSSTIRARPLQEY